MPGGFVKDIAFVILDGIDDASADHGFVGELVKQLNNLQRDPNRSDGCGLIEWLAEIIVCPVSRTS